MKPAVLALVAVLVAGCAPTPPPHPMGSGCTWPARIDPRRDAVLLGENTGGPATVALFDVETGTVTAQCTGVVTGTTRTGTGVDDVQSSSLGSVTLPPVGDGFRSAATAAGVVDLPTGALTPNPDPAWRAVAFPGAGRVLRERADADADPAGWCVAPSAGAPQAECAPLAADGPGAPALHDDGTVGWAPRRAVPVVYAAAGQQVPGTVQTDGRVVLQARVDEEDVVLSGPDSVVDASRRAGTISDFAFRFLTRYSPIAGHPVWYTIDDAGRAPVAATLHVARSTWREVADAVRTAGLSRPVVKGALVVDGGAAVVLSTLGGSPTATTLVRVDEKAGPRVVARIPLDPGTERNALGSPRILSWPGQGPSAAG